MKYILKVPAAKILPFLIVAAGAQTSCGLLQTEPPCPEEKYYAFTASDRQWQQFAPEQQWTFENQQHVRRQYRVGRVESREKVPLWQSGAQTEYLDYYFDDWSMRIERVDSVGLLGYFDLRRIPVYQHYDRSRLNAEFYWPGYAGQHNDMGGTYSNYLEFGEDLTVTNFRALTIRGKTYPSVTSFRASSIAINRVGSSPFWEITSEVDYDQQSGVVRFVTKNGNVWERIPN
ncbi:hypothetical protein LJ737_14665 [Hymenobacter sp. 15J16-1T3B]|uniref:hypothetical protein n=1 Tax=Hymenobacter sp. 15J16-1T3B TaxID=2886941 RepID=UPI001D1234B9|nr:hypothetical protein [Hymenobacter sp. 15J16-1T3B]MCC3158490.1 hypothetical protein [Hymenobacter sp. 15J16-1T3B]